MGDAPPSVSKTNQASERQAGPKVCESCGKAFPCNPGNCWCDRIEPLPEASRAERDQFKDCLCEECLRALAARNQK